MPKKYVFLFLLFSAGFLSASVFARDYPLGMYITSLYNFNYVDQTFCTDYWIWTLYDGEETDFDGCLDPVNDISFTSGIYSSEKIGNGKIWMQQKIQAVYQYKWDMRKFPFDTAILKIELEDYRDANEITFIADKENSGVSNLINVDGWEIISFNIEDNIVEYGTTFGNPLVKAESDDYSRVTAKVGIRRTNPWITFFKLTAGVYISILISFLPFFMKPNTDSRLSLPSAGLFAIVSNKYVVESTVPSSTSLTLLDSIHSTAMFCILLIFFVLIQTDGMRSTEEKNMIAKSFRIDHLFALIFAVVFVVINVMLFAM